MTFLYANQLTFALSPTCGHTKSRSEIGAYPSRILLLIIKNTDMVDLPTLLTNTLSPVNAVRVGAEIQIKTLISDAPAKAIMQFARNLADDSQPEQIRCLSAILFRNVVSPKAEEHGGVWLSVPAAGREQIKNYALMSLPSHSIVIRYGAAKVVSAIGVIELSRHEWSHLPGMLVENMKQSTNVELRLGSLEVVSRIFGELEEGAMSEGECAVIMRTVAEIATGKTEGGESKVAALNALTSMVQLCASVLRADQDKDILIRSVVSSCNDLPRVRAAALNCLVEIVKHLYDFITGPTLSQIQIATFPCISAAADIEDWVDDSALTSINVWSAICTAELARVSSPAAAHPCRDHVRASLRPLIAVLLDFMKCEHEDTEVPGPAASCLEQVGEIIPDSVLSPVLAFVAGNIGSEIVQCRTAAMLALGTILGLPDKPVINLEVQKWLPILLSMAEDENESMRHSAGWVLARVAELRFPALVAPAVLPNVVATMIVGVKDRNQEISCRACGGLGCLADWLRPGQGLSPFFKAIVDVLWKNGLREDLTAGGESMSKVSFIALGEVLQGAAPDVFPEVLRMLSVIAENFDKTLTLNSCSVGREQEAQRYLCICMAGGFCRVKEWAPLLLVEHVFDSLLASMKLRVSPYTEAVALSDTLLDVWSKPLSAKVPLLFPYLLQALKAADNVELQISSVECISTITHNLGPQIAPLVGELMSVLRTGAQANRAVLFHILGAVGDLAQGVGKAFFPTCLGDAFEIIKVARTRTISSSDEIMKNVLECYTAILRGGRNAGEAGQLVPHVPEMFDYMEKAEEGDVLKSLVELAADMAELYGKPSLDSQLSRPFVRRAVELLEERGDEEGKELARRMRGFLPGGVQQK